MTKESIMSIRLSKLWSSLDLRPPPPKICGSRNGPPITASRIQLRDGRYLAYREFGMNKEEAKHKIIFIHGFGSSSQETFIATNLSPDFVKELGIYVVGLDKPGYGESDPNSNRTVKSLALDIEELGDKLGLGSKFYVIGNSMGGQDVWGCLKFIPHRLAGVGLLAPVVNYWWPSLPAKLCSEAYNRQPLADQCALKVAHHAPWLTYWWNTQKFFPSSSVIARTPGILSVNDFKVLKKLSTDPERPKLKKYVAQQGEFESLHRAMMIGFGKWDFEPMDLENPFPNNEGSVHLWQGDEDKLVPVDLQRYIVDKLPWIKYHELSGFGHYFPQAEGMAETILRELLCPNNK